MKLPKIEMPEVKLPKFKKKKAETVSDVYERVMNEEAAETYEQPSYDDLYIWEEEIGGESFEESYSSAASAPRKRGTNAKSVLSEIKLPGMEELLKEENFRKLWFGEIAFAMLVAFASVLIGFAG